MKSLKKILSVFAVLALIVALLCACGDTVETGDESINTEAPKTEDTQTPETEAPETEDTQTPDNETRIAFTDAETVFGEGETEFTVTVTNVEGESKDYTVYTDETTVGAALLEIGLIAGEESEYGLYVKTVAGITLDYATDGMYWAFYIDGEYAMTGVDQTDITAGSVYVLCAE